LPFSFCYRWALSQHLFFSRLCRRCAIDNEPDRQGTKKRVRTSLGTKEVSVARQRRDTLFARYQAKLN
jgi:hypothetical protein